MALRSCTRTGFEKCTAVYTWAIEDFSFHPEDNDGYIVSDRFSTKHSDYDWKLKLYPCRLGEVYVSLSLYGSYTGKAKAKLCIVDEKKSQRNALTLGVRTFKREEEQAFGCIVRRKDLFDVSKGLLPDDTLTLCCEVTTLRPTTERGPKAPAVPSLEYEFRRLLENKDLSDMTLVAGEEEFHVHMAILAARSPVFRAMFQHDTKERSKNRVTIEDLSPEVVEGMLRYVYTNTVENLGTLAAGLLQAAVKYDIPGLRSLCEAHIWSNLSVENAVDTYRLADKHELTDLKQHVAAFIQRLNTRVVLTDGWKRALQEDSGIVECWFCSWCDRVRAERSGS